MKLSVQTLCNIHSLHSKYNGVYLICGNVCCKIMCLRDSRISIPQTSVAQLVECSASTQENPEFD